ncbi:MAG: alkaline phosphatase D family protein, partial [Chitinophagales bacterium]
PKKYFVFLGFSLPKCLAEITFSIHCISNILPLTTMTPTLSESFLSRSLILLFFSTILFISCKTNSPTIDTSTEKNLSAKPQQPNSSKNLQTIAFGSCNHQDSAQPLWKDIMKHEPDLWIWLGDIIYGDSQVKSYIEEQYTLQSKVKGYQKLLQTTPIVGIWDDHDYGVNDGGKEFAAKKQNEELLLDFLGIPQTADVRNREGAYQSYALGEKGKQVKVILLDSRYFRDKTNKVKGGYNSNLEGTILGEAQWKWLEKELQNSTAQIHLIANGIQVIPEEHRFEKWANFPNERQKLFDLIKKSQAKGVILLSGDRHIGEVSKLDIEGMDYPLYEFTSSGLTHAYTRFTGEKNKHRVGEVASDLNFGVLQIDWGKTIEVKALMLGANGKEYNTFTWKY